MVRSPYPLSADGDDACGAAPLDAAPVEPAPVEPAPVDSDAAGPLGYPLECEAGLDDG